MAVVEERISSKGKKSYRVRIRIKGLPEASETFSLKSDAKAWALKTELAMLQGVYFPELASKSRTVAEVIDLYVADLHLRNPRRYRDIDHVLDWWKAELGSLYLKSLTSEHILRCQHKLKGRKSRRRDTSGDFISISPATVNRYVVAFNTAIQFSVSPLKWMSFNPVSEIKPLKEPGGRTRYLSKDEIRRLLTATFESENTYLTAIVIMAIATGARRSEIQRMTWADVLPGCRAIVLQKTKNGEARTVPITGAAFELLEALHKKKGNDLFLFPSPNDPERPIDFRHAWEHALRKSEIKDFRFHDLRHTCASYMAMNGASLLELASALGHKTLAMVKRYPCKIFQACGFGQTVGRDRKKSISR